MNIVAELEDCAREMENTLQYRETELFAARRQIAGLKEDLEIAKKRLEWYAQFDEMHTPPWVRISQITILRSAGEAT